VTKGPLWWRSGTVGWSVLAVVALSCMFTWLCSMDSERIQVVVTLVPVVISLATSFLCAMASRHVSTRRLRFAWWLLSGAYACWAAAYAVWSYYLLSVPGHTSSQPLADVLRTLYYPLVFSSLMFMIPHERRAKHRATWLFDAVLVSLSSAGFTWHFLLLPALAGSNGSALTLLDMSYPIGDLLLVLGLGCLVLGYPKDRVPVSSLCLSGAIVLQIAVDTVHRLLDLQNLPTVVHSTDLFWVVAQIPVAFLALVVLSGSRLREFNAIVNKTADVEWVWRARLVLPYLGLPGSIVLLYGWRLSHLDVPGNVTAWTDAFALVLIGLVMFRQFLALLENKRLNRSMALLSTELLSLNRAAARLSHCLAPDQVVTTGLEMTCAAVSVPSGLVWVVDPDGTIVLSTQVGLTDRQVGVLAGLPNHMKLKETFLSGAPTVTDLGKLGLGWEKSSFETSVPVVLRIPLISRSSVLGVMLLLGTDFREFEERDLQLSQAIGAQVGVALENARMYEQARYLADRDSVTGLLNYRSVHQRLQEELQRARRGGRQLSVVMMDLDDFKLFNDAYGHLVGDKVLKKVADLLTENSRAFDVFGRLGGDEFIAILPDTGGRAAATVADRLRSSLVQHPCTLDGGTPAPVYMSFGVAAYPDDARHIQELIAYADANLYESKQRGGNTVTCQPSPVSGLERQTNVFGVVESIVSAINAKDHYTRRHSEQVAGYALSIAEALDLPNDVRRTLRLAGLLHDVGKIGVPDHVLRKPGPLTEEEQEMVRRHTMLGDLIIKELPNMEEVLLAVRYHHERSDGTGYPNGLTREETPLLARILAVADAYSAMTCERPYRRALTHPQAREELLRVGGSQLDLDLVHLFLRVIDTSKEAAAS
jgi:diguanylate cyclase (GGDEF)-like protein